MPIPNDCRCIRFVLASIGNEIHLTFDLLLAVCLPDDPEGNAKLMLSILDCLPRANRVTMPY